MNRSGLRSAGIAAAVVGVSVALFFSCFERRSVERWEGWSREARTNPYLASGQLLERMGHEVRFLDGPGELDELALPDGTLLIPVPRRTMGDERSQRLIEWVDDGGHLVVVTYTLWDEEDRKPDPIVDRFGLRQFEHPMYVEEEDVAEATEPVGDPPEDPEALEEGDEEEFDDWDDSFAYWPGRDEPTTVRFDWQYYLVDSSGQPAWDAEGDWGIHVASVRVGRGWLTVMTDEQFMTNSDIGYADHAEFLLRLARVRGGRGPVWIVQGESLPGLWSRARELALPALVALAAFLLAWLWRASRRFGPLMPPPPPERRRWLEHLEAVGRYLWRDDHGSSLLSGCRTRVERTLQLRHPRIARLPEGERAERLAEWAGLPTARVARALDAHFHPTSDGAFATAVADLERIRSSL